MILFDRKGDIPTSSNEVNAVSGSSPDVLEEISSKTVNVAIYEREISFLSEEIEVLVDLKFEFKASGDKDSICQKLLGVMDSNRFPNMAKDFDLLLSYFAEVSGVESFRVLWTTVNTNLCRRFHTDRNDLRMLCTYKGPGTLWLTEDNVNREALREMKGNESIVIDERRVQQVPTGAAVILKGAVYPLEGTKAVVHRSPTIEESGESRLLLRIDTN